MAQVSSNKRVAKNTLLLYIRTFVILIVNLYTSRIVLEVLGVEDYGIYNIVGGMVVMFSIISAALSNSITRFITFELGKGNKDKLKQIFSTSVNIQLRLSLIVAIAVEGIGVYFMYAYMQIPEDRLSAAFWVLQCSLLNFIISLVSLPYSAVIIAHERMNIFAYVGLLEAALKFVSAFLLFIVAFDHLILYGVLLALSSLIIRLIYGRYCSLHFKECKYTAKLDKNLTREMFGFAGWNFLGTGAYLFNTQGVNIVSNLFFGVAVNAARGVAGQAEAGVKQFVNNFTTALNPQIIKTYADKNYESCFILVRQGGKYSYLLMLVFFIPFVLEADFLLSLWLKEVPRHAVIFWQLAMLGTLIDLPAAPLTTLAQATGHIKKFYIYVGGLGCLVLPLTCIFFFLGMPPYTAYVAYITVYTYLVFVRLYLMNKQVGFPIRVFVIQVLLRVAVVTAISLILPVFIVYIMPYGFVRFILVASVSFISIVGSTFLFGMDRAERKRIKSFVLNKIRNN